MIVCRTPVPSRRARAVSGPRVASNPSVEPLEARALLSLNPISPDPLDHSFGGGDGFVLTGDAPVEVATDIVADSRGGYVVVGRHDGRGGGTDFALRRYNADGSPDSGFGNGGLVLTDFGGEDFADAALVQPDGKIVVAGGSNPSDPVPGKLALARYLPDGSLDATFGAGGKVLSNAVDPFVGVYNQVAGVVRQSTGRLVVGLSAGDDFIAAAFRPDGTLDTSFAGDGVAEVDFGTFLYSNVTGVAVRPDDNLVLAGNTAASAVSVVRLEPNGSPDATFGTAGKATFDPGVTFPKTDDVVLQGDKILVGVNLGEASVLRFTESGSIDTTFGAGGRAPAPPLEYVAGITSLEVQPDGKILHSVWGIDDAVVRYTPDGQLDPTFGQGGAARLTTPGGLPFLSGRVAAMVALPDGDIVLGDTFLSSALAAARLNSDGSVDTGFGAYGYGLPDFPPGNGGSFDDVAVLPGNKLLAVGTTFTTAGVRDVFLARFNADGSFDMAFGGGDGKATADFGPEDTAQRLAVLPDGKIMVYGSVLARFNADGTADLTFGGGDAAVVPTASGEGLALQPDGRIVVIEGNTVARYNPDGSLDTTFATGGRYAFDRPIGLHANPLIPFPYSHFLPKDVAYQHTTGKIVVGGTARETTDELDDFAVARLNLDGTLDTTFGTVGLAAEDSGYIDAGGRIALGADGTVYMAGGLEGAVPALVTVGPTGAPTDYVELGEVGSVFGAEARDVAVGPDGRVVLVGSTEVIDPMTDRQHSDIVVARFNPTGPAVFTTDVFEFSWDRAYGVTVAGDGDVVAAGAVDGTPVLVRYDSGAFDVPQVRQAWAAGTAWTTPFRDYLNTTHWTEIPANGLELFNRHYPGYALAKFADRPLPFVNLNQVTFQFDRPVSVGRGDLRVGGVNVQDYSVSDFHYDPAARTATWTLAAPIGADKVGFVLNPAKFGPGASLRLDVLPGDVDQSGAVVAADASAVKRSFFRTVSDPGPGPDDYSIFRDVNCNGAILADDFSEVKRRFFTRLPSGEPGAAAVALSATRDLFGTVPLLA